MRRSYFVGGVNGVGKSKFLETLSEGRDTMRVVHGTAVLLEALGLPTEDYEALRSAPRAEKNRAYSGIVLRSAIADIDDGTVLFDSHYLNMIRGEIFQTVYGADESRMFALDALVLVTTSDPITVTRRVDGDTHRDRQLYPPLATEVEKQGFMRRYWDETRTEFNRLVGVLAIPSLVIYNDTEDMSGAIEQFLAFDASLYPQQASTARQELA